MTEIMNISYKKIAEDSKLLAKKIPKDKYVGVYGIPNGGILPAYIISEKLKIPLIEKLQGGRILIVDDLIDSGRTLENVNKGMNRDVAVLYVKKNAPHTANYFLKEIGNEWLNLPHENDKYAVENNIVRLLQYIGEDPNREGLRDTPKRVIKSYKELYGGYGKKVDDILTVFEGESYDQMVLLKDIDFHSSCEHHMLTFSGKAHVAYIPNKKIVGISKLARIVDIFSRRLQNQERLTMQIGESIRIALSPQGVAVVLEGEHLCMKCRGVQKQNSVMKTAFMSGAFRDSTNIARSEFYELIK